MRPDEHPDLAAMGPGEATCDRCAIDVFPNQSDDLCTGCKLNPLTSEQAMRDFTKAAVQRTAELTPEQILERQRRLTPS